MRPLLFILIFILHPSLHAKKMAVIVSIPPQQFMLEFLAGDWLDIESLVQAGQNPEHWIPKPQQLAKITKTTAFFQINLPFEQVWRKKIKQLNPQIKLFKFTPNKGSHTDPHSWVDPTEYLALLEQTTNILKTQLLPQYKQQIHQNSEQLKYQIKQLDQNLKQQFKHLQQTTFWVYHPAWGYFAKHYGLTQIAIEEEGKAPSARQLSTLIKKAKQQKVPFIFIQPQFNNREVNVLAQAISAKIQVIDPLAKDYLQNMRYIGAKLSQSLK